MFKLKTLVIGLSTAFLLSSYSYANSTNEIVSMAEDIDPVAQVQLGMKKHLICTLSLLLKDICLLGVVLVICICMDGE